MVYKCKKVLSIFLAVLVCLSIVPVSDLGIEASAVTVTYESMLERAEAIVNYKWIPSKNIDTWKNRTYNGRGYFKAGETVTGMPYTLFTTEVVSFSLLSLSQYKEKASSNYSTSAYCVAVGENRTGPVYGSCCADFVCEVFGGSFMNGSSTRFHLVSDIKNSPCAKTTTDVKAEEIKAGVALSNTAETHIVWVGEVTDSYITIYEQTPPVAKKTKLYKSSNVNSNGYLKYGDSVYNIVTESKELVSAPGKPTLSVSDKNTSDKAVTFTWNRTENTAQYDLRIYNYGDYNVGAPYGIWDLNVATTSGYHKLPAGKYAAYITSVSSTGAETGSEWVVFDVVDPPGKSVLTATPGAMVTDGVTFNWTKAANAHTYDLRVYHYGDYDVGAPFYEFGMSASKTSTVMKLPVGKYSAYITTVASNGAFEGGDSQWISFTVSEPTKDTNYPNDIKSYKMWEGLTATKVFDTQTFEEYYLDDNELTIECFYNNSWAKIKHEVDGVEKTSYIPVDGLICEKAEPAERITTQQSKVYTRYTCNTVQSTLDEGAKVLVIGTYKTDLTQICYLKNGTYYIGWILNDVISDKTYTISYDANGGAGAPVSQTKKHGTDLILSTTEPTRAGYCFRGWATNSTATEPVYKPGAAYSVNEETTLYAVWKKVFYGDIYNDGIFNYGDVLYATQVVNGEKTASSYAVLLGDVDGDGNLDSDDINLMSQFYSKDIHSFPVEELVSEIDIYTMPLKTSYESGETISTQGMEVIVLYNDKDSAALWKSYHIINNGYTISPNKASETGDQVITVTLGQWTTEFKVTVTSLHTHSYTSVTKEATCKTEGSTTHTCITCGDTYSVTIPKDYDNHEGGVVTEGFTAATCYSEGYSGDTYCDSCGNMISKGTSIPKRDHAYMVIEHVDVTCSEDGYTVYYCHGCSGYYREDVKATGHKDNDGNNKCDNCDTVVDKAKNCSCMCHKTGIFGFIWKIIKVIYKIFGTNKACNCGINHY